jgi:hypothetical protein
MDTSKRGTQTSKLKNVIQVLVLGNKSGVLTVTANTTPMAQEGRIVLIRGTITEVRLGNVVGQRALHALLQWGICYFVFNEVDTNTEPEHASFVPPVSGPLGLTNSGNPGNVSRYNTDPGITNPGNPGNISRYNTDPGITNPGNTGNISRYNTDPGITNPGNTGNISRYNTDPGIANPGGTSGAGQRNTGPIQMPPEHVINQAARHEPYNNNNWRSNTGNREVPPVTPDTSAASPIVPVRLRRNDESFQRISYAGLSRMHMHLFLLIDGERNIHDLARLLHRSESDVEKLLFDLKVFDIIHF